MGGYIAATRHASISRGWNILKIRRSIKISFFIFSFFFPNETFSCGNSEIINVEISAFRDTVSREGWNFCEDFSYWGKEEEGFAVTSINVVIVSV